MSRVLDDRHPDIQYGADWAFAGGPDEYMGTTTLTGSGRSVATLRFIGTGVQVFGTISATGVTTPPTTWFSVDGNPSTIFRGTSTSRTQYSYQFFSTDGLSRAWHTLEIRHNSGTLFLDYIVLTGPSTLPAPDPTPDPAPPPNPAPSQSSAPTGGSNSTPTGPQRVDSSSTSRPSQTSQTTETSTFNVLTGSLGASSSAGSTTQASTDSVTNATNSLAPSNTLGAAGSPLSSEQKTPVGAIAGSVIGGLVIICGMVIALAYMFRSRNRGKASPHDAGNVSDDPPAFTPGTGPGMGEYFAPQFGKAAVYTGHGHSQSLGSGGHGTGDATSRSFSPQSWPTSDEARLHSMDTEGNISHDPVRDGSAGSQSGGGASWASRSVSPPSVVGASSGRGGGHSRAGSTYKTPLSPLRAPSVLSRNGTSIAEGGIPGPSSILNSPVDGPSTRSFDLAAEVPDATDVVGRDSETTADPFNPPDSSILIPSTGEGKKEMEEVQAGAPVSIVPVLPTEHEKMRQSVQSQQPRPLPNRPGTVYSTMTDNMSSFSYYLREEPPPVYRQTASTHR